MAFNSQGKEGAVGKVRQAVFDEFANRYFPGPWPNGSLPKDVTAAHARLLAGFYDDSRRADTSFLSLLGLAAPVRISVADDGSIVCSLMNGRSGAPRHYREVAPFVWRDVSSGWRLAAKVVDGRVVRFSMDELSAFMVFEPSPAWRSAAWVLPGMGVALIACLLTGVFWPIAAISRRRHRVVLPVTGIAHRGHKVSRWVAVAISAVTLSWFGILVKATQDLDFLSPSLDPALLLMYAFSVIVYLGGSVAMLWSAWVAWNNPRPVAARIWTTVLALSALMLLYFAWLFHLMSFVTQY
jgi:hypothetical protein